MHSHYKMLYTRWFGFRFVKTIVYTILGLNIVLSTQILWLLWELSLTFKHVNNPKCYQHFQWIGVNKIKWYEQNGHQKILIENITDIFQSNSLKNITNISITRIISNFPCSVNPPKETITPISAGPDLGFF